MRHLLRVEDELAVVPLSVELLAEETAQARKETEPRGGGSVSDRARSCGQRTDGLRGFFSLPVSFSRRVN